jgi:septal ring factor EnvC (AmiA/AmiB activator)
MSSPGRAAANLYQQPPRWEAIIADSPGGWYAPIPANNLGSVAPPYPSYQGTTTRRLRLTTALFIVLLAAVSAGAVMVSTHFYDSATLLQAEVDDLQTAIIEIDEEAEGLRNELTRLTADHQLAVTGRDSAKTQATNIATQLEDANSHVTALEHDLADYRGEINELERLLTNQRSETNRLKAQLEAVTGARAAVEQATTSLGNCVSNLSRLDSLIASPDTFTPATATTWLTEHRSLCQSALTTMQALELP